MVAEHADEHVNVSNRRHYDLLLSLKEQGNLAFKAGRVQEAREAYWNVYPSEESPGQTLVMASRD